MKKDFIANLLVNQSKKTMIDSIDNTDDIDFLKKELKKQLRENWDRQEEKDNLIKDLELLIEYVEGEDASRYDKIYAECARNILKNVRSGKYE